MPDLFTDSERLIYGPYWNGQQDADGKDVAVWADPLMIHRALYQLAPDLQDVLNQLFPEDKGDAARQVAAETAARIGPVVAQAFGLTLFDPATGKGCLTRYCVRLLADFLDWCERQKKTP